MKGYYIIFKLILLILILINPILLYIFLENIFNIYKQQQYLISFGVSIISFFYIVLLINKFFYSPIFDLEIAIKKFYIGEYKDKDIEFKKTPNTNINYTLNFFSKTLNTLKNIKDEFVHGKAIKSEVEIAKEIQGKMLDKILTQVPSLDIIIKSKSAAEIGGDSYDIIKQEDMYYIYVGDATGHGVGAGFIMIMVNALISGFAKIFKSGSIILSKTNEILKPRVKANLLMSLLLLRWDENEKKIFITGAGHEYLMIYKAKENKTYKIKSGGIALGMIKDISKVLKEREIKFEKNDIIVIYSDGITEAINRPNKDGKEIMFGEQRLVQTINNSPNGIGLKIKTANSVFNNITIELSRFMGYKHCQLDDITLGVIHYIGEDKEKNPKNDIGEDFITEWNW